MKKALLLFLSFGLFVGLQAQVTITLDPVPAMGSADLDDLTTDPQDVAAHASITNNSSEVKTFRWLLEEISAPELWAVAVCDVNTCYNPGTLFAEFELQPNQTSIMDVHVYPSGDKTTLEGAVPGDGEYTVKITETGNTDNTVTGTYNVTITGSPYTSLSELEIAQLRLFPNPTTDYFQLEGPDGVEKIVLYNLLGREMGTFPIQSSNSYDVSHLARGMYMVALIDEEGSLLKTVRLQKK